MRRLRTRLLLATMALSALVGCAVPQVQNGATSGMPGDVTTQVSPSMVTRDSARTSLIYVAGTSASYVVTLKTGKLVGTISPGAVGACSDNSGNVYLVEGSEVAEYAHGSTTPFATLTFGPSTGGQGCSVDATTGNLAVGVVYKGGIGIAVFQGARGTPQMYSLPIGGSGSCGYDDHGNLFAAGESQQNGIELAELPKGANAFQVITIDQILPGDGYQVQWDGSDLAIEGVYGRNGTVYRLRISGSVATLVGTEKLLAARHPTASWIQGKRILVPFGPRRPGASKIGFWTYPKGGRPDRVLSSKALGSNLSPFNALTVSPAGNGRR